MARTRIRPEPPRQVDPEVPVDLAPAALARSADVLGVHIRLDGAPVDGAHARVGESRLGPGTADRLDLTGATLRDVEIVGLSLAELIARDGTWHAVGVDGGRVGTMELSRARVDAVSLRGVRIDYLSLASATVRDLRFEGCRIGTLDLPGARLDRVAFVDCTAEEVDTRALDARDLDLRGLDAAGFTDVRSLRGATIAASQAGMHARALAAALGIDVREGGGS